MALFYDKRHMYRYQARVVRVPDDDNVVVDILLRDAEDLGFGHVQGAVWLVDQQFRLAYKDVPNMGWRPRHCAELLDTNKATQFVKKWLKEAADTKGLVDIETVKDRTSWNKYLIQFYDPNKGEWLHAALEDADIEKEKSKDGESND